MFDKANKRRQSVEIKPQDRGSLKRSRPQDDENELEKSNKKQRIQILQRETNQEMKIAEIREKELNDENIWKENKKVRKDYFCKTNPSLVFTPVNGRGLISQTSILKFVGINEKGFVKKLKAHTFSQSWKTCVKAEDAQRAIDEKIITIGFNEAKCEIFENGYSNLHANQRTFEIKQDKFQTSGYEPCWIEINIPASIEIFKKLRQNITKKNMKLILFLQLKRKYRKSRTEVDYKRYKRAAMQLKRKLRQEKQEYLIKSIESLNKVSIIPTLVEPWKEKAMWYLNENKQDFNDGIRLFFI
ncbi:hypothetical protein RFI_26332 [Reticulomyxa filosa]|uniref:Uncharacterized protein n=1 Tax=Reticulomyxa filosa TaxID=46433 RepID=X6MB10_RETFI|nr:hypothetical protein RFI_26332 [Reticulomyxa filosa]|eukprot:ETO11044.1 hypothetical protein RFI_26332 [Reticulomyxa filosa]